jgi:integrase/recombinase XerC
MLIIKEVFIFMSETYNEHITNENTIRLRELTAELPSYVKTFLRGIEPTTESRTRIAYARDIKSFFEFLIDANPVFKNKKPNEITLQNLSDLEPEDIEEYLEYLKLYKKNGKTYSNGDRAIKRKLSTLRVLYAYLYKNDRISSNPAEKVDMPKIRGKNIIRMDPNEVANFLDAVEYGNTLTKRQQAYHNKTKNRDLAIMTLMLGTGIRVSECVGIDINDVDFDNSRIRIIRKGGYESFVYFGDEVYDALSEYLEIRKKQVPLDGHENALFLSNQMRRITVRSVENIVKKYAQTVTPMKHITPHKLRSTYGTELYRETGDIYLVADVLGHSDVNTTKKHYADIDEERKRFARDKVTLREKTTPQN